MIIQKLLQSDRMVSRFELTSELAVIADVEHPHSTTRGQIILVFHGLPKQVFYTEPQIACGIPCGLAL